MILKVQSLFNPNSFFGYVIGSDMNKLAVMLGDRYKQ